MTSTAAITSGGSRRMATRYVVATTAGQRLRAVDGFGHLESRRRAQERGLRFLVVGLGVQALLRPLAGTLRTRDVDLVGELGDVGQDDHAVVGHLDEPAVDGHGLLALLREEAPDDADPERTEEREVTGEKRDVTLRRTEHEHVGIA